MNRRLVAVAVGTFLVAGVLVPSGTAAAAPKPVITAQGTVTCGGAGKVKINPPITNVPQSGIRTFTAKFKWPCVGFTGNVNVPVASVKARMTMTAPASVTCSSFVASHQGWSTRFDLAWKSPGGKINPSVATFSGAMVTQHPDIATMSGLTIFVPRIVNQAIPDPVSVTGSWSNTDNRFGNLQVNGGLAGVQAGCASNKGLKKLTLTANSFVLSTVIIP